MAPNLYNRSSIISWKTENLMKPSVRPKHWQLDRCKTSLPGLISVRTGLGRHFLQDEDHSRSDPHSFLGFLVNPGCLRNGSAVSPGLWAQKNFFSLDKAPKMQFSVLLNSWDSFFVTLPSISSDT